MKKFIFVMICAVFSLQAFADPKSALFERYHERKQSSQKRNFLEGFLTELGSFVSPAPLTESDTKWFDQQLDHHLGHRAGGSVTFKQRYYLNSEFATGPDSPVLYYICGEASCDAPVFHGAILQHAKNFHAHMIALEHRYYGQSQPFSDLSAEHLKYLTTENAIEDLASFQRFAVEQFGLKGRWITIGGSYPGSLSAYYRLKHPELATGALASSGPVRAKADFEEYDLDVNDVAGPECAQVIRNVVKQVEAALDQPNELARIQRIFDAEGVRHSTDFLYILADMAAIAIQYGHRDSFCKAVLTSDHPLESYAEVGKKLFADFGITPEQDTLQWVQNDDLAPFQDGVGMRQWFYQSCRDFGYFQIAYHDPARSTRSARVDLQYHLDACQKIFGLSPVDTAATNRDLFEPLLHPSTREILFTNGATDPWSKLSLTPEDMHPGLQAIIIPQAAHCDDLRGARPSEPAGVTQARGMFSDLLKQWVR